MPEFLPSPHSYGSASPAVPAEEETNYVEMLSQYAPALSQLFFGGDPREKAATIKARIENYRKLYNATSFSPLRNLYAMRINTLTAELAAVEEQAGEERTAAATTHVGKLALIALVVGGIVVTGTVGWYFVQKAQTEKWKRVHVMR
jgi:hypothetical protein